MTKAVYCGLAAILVALLSGCDSRPDVATYPVPKEQQAAPAPAATAVNGQQMRALPGMADSTAHAHQPEWSAPQAWQALPTNNIRRGAWAVSNAAGQSAEVTVTVFAGNVGSLLQNVNRWRGQIGLGDIGQEQLAQVVAERELAKTPSHVVTLVNPQNGQTSITALVPHDDMNWFFKIMGDTALITEQAPQWESFLKSIHFAGH